MVERRERIELSNGHAVKHSLRLWKDTGSYTSRSEHWCLCTDCLCSADNLLAKHLEVVCSCSLAVSTTLLIIASGLSKGRDFGRIGRNGRTIGRNGRTKRSEQRAHYCSDGASNDVVYCVWVLLVGS